MNPKISIIVINYNYENYLREALESVRVQTFKDFECIVIDDASTDDSVKVIQEYCDKDNRFQLIQHKENKGPSAARNTGINAAKGEYIMFLDSDDAYTHTAAEVLYTTAEMYTADVVRGEVAIVGEDYKFIESDIYKAVGTPGFHILPNDYNNLVQEMNICKSKGMQMQWVGPKIYRKAALAGIMFPENIRQNEDACWTYRMQPNINKIASVYSITYVIRQTQGGTSRRDPMTADLSFLHQTLEYFETYVFLLYPPEFRRDFVLGWLGYANDLVKAAIDSGNRANISNIVRQLVPFYHHESRPTKFLSRKARISLWLTLHNFVTPKKNTVLTEWER
jgi:glycosyltransferase involved in cell wall biosynthesis